MDAWVFAAFKLAKALYDEITGGPVKESYSGGSVGQFQKNSAEEIIQALGLRGLLDGRKIVVLGRTGAGKSSLINMLIKKKHMQVGDVESTTRWIEGVGFDVGGNSYVLVDTPGQGEAGTSSDYYDLTLRWMQEHRLELELVMLLVQADAKAHAEDESLWKGITEYFPTLPKLIVLSQVDKVLPVRMPLPESTWRQMSRESSEKAENIGKKIGVVSSQFKVPECDIVPVAYVDGKAFNREDLLRRMEMRLVR